MNNATVKINSLWYIKHICESCTRIDNPLYSIHIHMYVYVLNSSTYSMTKNTICKLHKRDYTVKVECMYHSSTLFKSSNYLAVQANITSNR